MELKNFTIEDYLLKRKNGESNYDIFAQVVSNQGGSINYFGTICCNKQETGGLVDIFSIDKIIEQFDGEEFLKVAALYKQYMELADAQDQDLALRKAVLDELNKYGLPVSLHEIKNEITKRSVQIPTGDELVDRLEKLFFEFESDYDDCNGDFYLMKAKEAQRKGVDNYLSNISLVTLYEASGTKIEELYKEKKYDRDLLDKLRNAKTACVCFYTDHDDNELPTPRIAKAIKLLNGFNCLVTEEEFISNVEKAIAQLNGETVKSPITRN